MTHSTAAQAWARENDLSLFSTRQSRIYSMTSLMALSKLAAQVRVHRPDFKQGSI